MGHKTVSDEWMKNDLTTGAWQHNIGCPISITLLSTSDVLVLLFGVHSISRKADEIYTDHLRTCMPSQKSYLILLPHIVLTHALELPVPLLPLLVVLTCVLPPLVPLLPPLVVLTRVLPPPVPLLPPLVVLTCILPPPVPLL
jgi:hypothetical protein